MRVRQRGTSMHHRGHRVEASHAVTPQGSVGNVAAMSLRSAGGELFQSAFCYLAFLKCHRRFCFCVKPFRCAGVRLTVLVDYVGGLVYSTIFSSF